MAESFRLLVLLHQQVLPLAGLRLEILPCRRGFAELDFGDPLCMKLFGLGFALGFFFLVQGFLNAVRVPALVAFLNCERSI